MSSTTGSNELSLNVLEEIENTNPSDTLTDNEIGDLSSIEFLVDNSNLDPLNNCGLSDQDLVSRFLGGELCFDYVEQSEETSEEKNNTLPQDDPSSEASTSTKKKCVKPSGGKVRKVVTKLPPALKGLMGEANLRCARGDKETAVKICLEIIRQVPTAAEPFQTLAGIYEETGDREKSLQMSLVAAHLSPTDVFGWIHLADLSEELGNTRQAITCLTKAINLDVQNMELHKKRTALLEKIGDKRTAIKGYLKLLYSLDQKQGDYVVSVAKFVAEMCHKENDLEKANGALEVAIEKCPQLISMDFVNLHLELLLALKNYQRCLEIMVAFCDLVVEAETITDNVTGTEVFSVIDCNIPSTTPVDILAKLAIVLIQMNAFHLIEKIMAPMIELDISEVGELYLDIAEAYVEQSMHTEACALFGALVNSDAYSLPGVWLKYAESLKNIGRFEDAVDAYYNVVEQAPQHNNAKLTLASLLVTLSRQEEAIHVLTQNEEDLIDPGLLYERCKLLREDPERLNDFVTIAHVLFLRHSMRVQSKDELAAISTIQRHDKKRNAIRVVRDTRKDLELDEEPEFHKGLNEPPLEVEWLLFKDVCNLCMQNKLYSKMQSLTVSAQLSSLFYVFKTEIDLLSVLAALYNKDSFNAYNLIRILITKNINNSKLWQLFNLVINKSEDARHNRFIMRLLARNPNHPALGILHGNNCLASGTYKYAMHEYSAAYAKKPTPLCALLFGLTYLQMAAQKFSTKKHCLVIQALGLLSKYKEMRGPAGLQESHYNLGRAFHHLGLYSSAIFHYKQALECNLDPLAKNIPGIFNLQREAAFNLHLIYNQSGAYDLARLYIEKYIVV